MFVIRECSQFAWSLSRWLRWVRRPWRCCRPTCSTVACRRRSWECSKTVWRALLSLLSVESGPCRRTPARRGPTGLSTCGPTARCHLWRRRKAYCTFANWTFPGWPLKSSGSVITVIIIISCTRVVRGGGEGHDFLIFFSVRRGFDELKTHCVAVHVLKHYNSRLWFATGRSGREVDGGRTIVIDRRFPFLLNDILCYLLITRVL